MLEEDWQPEGAGIAIWRNRDFLLLWGGQGVSTLGSRISSAVALPLLVLALTGSPAQAGFIGTVRLIPNLVLGLVAGAVADHWDRRLLLVVCDIVRAAALGSIPAVVFLGHLSLVQLYVVAIVDGTALSFFNVAQVAALPRVVPPEQLHSASAYNTSMEAAADTAGPGIAGYIIGAASSTIQGCALAFILDSLSFVASVLSLLAIRTPMQMTTSPIEWRRLRAHIVEGLHFVWSLPAIRVVTVLGISLSFLYGPMGLAVIVLAQQVFHANSATIGLLFSLSGAGGIAGSLVAPIISRRLSTGHIIVAAIAARSLVMILVASGPSLVFVGLGVTLVNFLWPIYFVAQLSYRLSVIPDQFQGRANAAIRLCYFAAGSAGVGAGGALLQAFGARAVLWAITVGFAISAIFMSLSNVRRI